jgi:EmrB/QacA subfamily drug resistance transporter
MIASMMRKWWPLITVCLGTFMLLVDVTIVNVALPDMAVDLGTSFSSLQWVVDAYALALAALLMGIGAIADIQGHRRVYIAGLTLFAVSSMACGLAADAGLLIAARAVQGIGGAAMFATTFALLNSSYQGRDRGTAYGIWGAVSGASAAVGPIVGGLLTQGLSWRWIFFVNVPISVAAVALSLVVLAGGRPPARLRLDLPGMATFTVAAAALTFAMIRAGDDGWGSATVLGLLALGVAALAVFVVIERRSDHPLLDLALFRNRTFVGVMVAALLLNFAAFAFLTYTSIWLQSLIGLSPIEAGLTGLPLSISSIIVSASIGRFLNRAAPGPIIGGGLLLIGAGALLCAAFVGPGSSWPALVAGFAVIGLGVGLATPTLSSTAMGAVPPQRGGMAAGAVNTARQLGFAFGIALLGSVFASRAAGSLDGGGVPGASGVANALAGGQARTVLAAAPQYTDAVRSAFATGLDATFVVAGVGGIVAGVAVLLLTRPARREASLSPAAGS